MTVERRANRFNPEVFMVTRPDYYTVHRPRQPKLEVAEYVESCGILVPRRFDSLYEARASGLPFIARSEHPQDYDGVSDLIDTLTMSTNARRLGKQAIEEDGLHIDWPNEEMPEYLGKVWGQIYGLLQSDVPQDVVENAMRRLSISKIQKHCRILGLPFVDFLNDVSYSYWELIGGRNYSVIADSAIKGKYHVIYRSVIDNYICFQDGKVVLNSAANVAAFDTDDIAPLVDLYERVRSQARFSPTHCPLIEMQEHDGEYYFLQYLRTRDFQSADFTLDRPAGADEVDAQLVRGVTPPEGSIVNIIIYDKDGYDISFQEGYVDSHHDGIYDEIMARRRGVLFLIRENLWERLEPFAAHQFGSKYFKSGLAIALERADAYEKLFTGLPKFADVDVREKAYQIPLHVVSDGNRALIKRV